MAGHTRWVMIDQVEPDYLDGIKSQYDIRRDPDRTPVAYAFSEDEARLIAAAPTMYSFVASRAESGDKEASIILEQIDGRS